MSLSQILFVCAGVSVAGWFVVFGIALVITRPRLPEATGPISDLGAESPAVASFLVNGWQITQDAAESTLVDLAARDAYEFRQVGPDPARTTVHLRATPTPSGLSEYERMVLDRVRGRASNNVVPLTALPNRSDKQAAQWAKRFRKAVITDARRLGLTRPRWSSQILTLLYALMAPIIGFVALAILVGDGHSVPAAIWAGVLISGGLSAVIMSTGQERETPQGQACAARWLGVQRYLSDRDGFADAPPASVIIWDRWLAYGVALGEARLTSQIIELGLGSRRRIWSAYGGTWRRVNVSYPRWRLSAAFLPFIFVAGFAGIFGSLVVLQDGRRPPVVVTIIYFGLAVLAIGAIGWLLIRWILDLIYPREVTGKVLLIREYQRNKTSVTTYHLVIDEGTSDETKAWTLPAALNHGFGEDDIVTAKVHPRAGRVVAVKQ